jgi:hypothetical protein
MIYNSLYKTNDGLKEKEATFLYKYSAPMDFHNCSLMNLNVKPHVAKKESKHVEVGMWREGV